MSYPVLTPEELRQAVTKLPRVDLAHLPTPLEEAPRFADRIGCGSRIFIKRDDCTGMVFGGNKTRQNEFVMADAVQKGADVLIWGGSVQSNNCRQTAAACAKLGIECCLYLSRASHDAEIQGNLLLNHLLGAKIEIVDAPIGPELYAIFEERAKACRAIGRKPYVWDRKHVRSLAAVGYIVCLIEVLGQLRRQRLEPAAIYVCSSGSTGAGLALAHFVMGLPCPLKLVCPIRWPWDTRADVAETANQTAALLGLPHRLSAENINATEEYVGSGYGTVTPECREALDTLARTEAILLDPVYSAKAMACLIDDVRKQRLPRGVVVFIHTGGQPAVFAYRDELMAGRK